MKDTTASKNNFCDQYPISKGIRLGSAFLATITLSGSPLVAMAAENFCSKTSHAALNACRKEALDDYWIGIGNSHNRSDDGARTEDRRKAAATLGDARRDCVDQFDARQAVCEALGQAPYDPQIGLISFEDPLAIGDTVTPNPYFPLVPGTQWVYQNIVGGESITVRVTYNTKEIQGVNCIVVEDVVTDTDTGMSVEVTDDYYAQDTAGNVWYFGEISQEFEDGDLVSLEGSWRAGVDSAKAGILMEAYPQVDDVYRQEFSLGNAEDVAEVVGLGVTEPGPYFSCEGDCLKTKDYTPIEPDLFENKFYKADVGVILEIKPQTEEHAEERVELVEKSTF